jgi:hypothetical protein
MPQFDYPGLLKVYRFWEDDGAAYIVMVLPFHQGVAQENAAVNERPARRSIAEPVAFHCFESHSAFDVSR